MRTIFILATLSVLCYYATAASLERTDASDITDIAEVIPVEEEDQPTAAITDESSQPLVRKTCYKQ